MILLKIGQKIINAVFRKSFDISREIDVGGACPMSWRSTCLEQVDFADDAEVDVNSEGKLHSGRQRLKEIGLIFIEINISTHKKESLVNNTEVQETLKQ